MNERGTVSIVNAEHYTWPAEEAAGTVAHSCDGWYLHRSAGLSVIQERMPPGTAEQRHRHQHATQFFYVLSGALTIEQGGESFTLQPGAGLSVANGLVHQVFNRGQQDAHFLVISQPPSHGDRIAVKGTATG